LVLAGTEATDNTLADEDGNFVNISLVRKLAPFDWDILEFLNSGIEATNCNGDRKLIIYVSHTSSVIDAIFVGVDHLMKKAKTAKGKPEKHVLVVSNLEGETDISQLDEVIDRLQKAEVLLNLIGLHIPPEGDTDAPAGDSAGPSTAPTDSDGKSFVGAMLQRVQAFGQILDALDGESFDFTDAIPALALFETRGVSQRAWKAPLTIGDSFSIPVAGYTAVREARPPPMRDMYAPDPSVPVRAVTTYHLNDELQTPVDISETVRGIVVPPFYPTGSYMPTESACGLVIGFPYSVLAELSLQLTVTCHSYRYGASLVPFSDEDLEKIKEPEEKCFSVIGFTRSENVPRHLYVGNSVMFFVADTPAHSSDTGDAASTAFSALAQALFELDAVALVRRVYSRSTAPVLGVVSGLLASLTPERIPNPWIQRLFTCVRERGLASTSLVASSTPASLAPPTPAISDPWPTLNTANLPGLDSVVQAIRSALAEPSSELRRALRELNQLMPEVVPTESEVVPGKKRPAEGDENERIKKKKRAMASELFGISTEPTTSELRYAKQLASFDFVNIC
uniref:Ku domain-containing protein n=1 Tax=Schistocephalus solidus TaxID=70667 RepID=A0A183SYU2_SCHSO